MKNKLLLLIFFGVYSSSFSQDFARDYRLIIERFQNLSSYSIQTKVNMLGDEPSTISAFVKYSKYGKHFKMGESELIINNNYFVSIDHGYKEIKVQKGNNFNYKIKKDKDDIGMDELEKVIRDSTHVKYLGRTNSYKTYEIYVDSAIDKLVVKIDLETGFFREIEYVFTEKTEGLTGYKVIYSSFLSNPTLSKHDFSQDQVYRIVKSKVILTSKYKDYQISFID